MSNDRRLLILLMTPAEMAAIFSGECTVNNLIPGGAKIRAIDFDLGSAMYQILVEHESFLEVPPGMLVECRTAAESLTLPQLLKHEEVLRAAVERYGEPIPPLFELKFMEPEEFKKEDPKEIRARWNGKKLGIVSQVYHCQKCYRVRAVTQQVCECGGDGSRTDAVITIPGEAVSAAVTAPGVYVMGEGE